MDLITEKTIFRIRTNIVEIAVIVVLVVVVAVVVVV